MLVTSKMHDQIQQQNGYLYSLVDMEAAWKISIDEKVKYMS
jgi:hypothetical protein